MLASNVARLTTEGRLPQTRAADRVALDWLLTERDKPPTLAIMPLPVLPITPPVTPTNCSRITPGGAAPMTPFRL